MRPVDCDSTLLTLTMYSVEQARRRYKTKVQHAESACVSDQSV
jgi:hypothetical protein